MGSVLQKYKLLLEYEGSGYRGWQIQGNNQATIQGEVETAFFKITQEKVRVTGSGRTDTGVHALGQVAHVSLKTSIPPEKLVRALNAHLPKDIVVRQMLKVPESFHARYDAKRKRYRYRLWNHPFSSPLRSRQSWWVSFPLDFERMQEASRYLLGEKDFSSFASKKDPEKSGVRRIFEIIWEKKDSEILFEIEGSGFLYNMVRAIIGSLVEVGRGKWSVVEFQKKVDLAQREEAGVTAPPQGLCLVSVFYEEDRVQ